MKLRNTKGVTTVGRSEAKKGRQRTLTVWDVILMTRPSQPNSSRSGKTTDGVGEEILKERTQCISQEPGSVLINFQQYKNSKLNQKLKDTMDCVEFFYTDDTEDKEYQKHLERSTRKVVEDIENEVLNSLHLNYHSNDDTIK